MNKEITRAFGEGCIYRRMCCGFYIGDPNCRETSGGDCGMFKWYYGEEERQREARMKQASASLIRQEDKEMEAIYMGDISLSARLNYDRIVNHVENEV